MTQTDQQNVPKLRFPGFEGTWKTVPSQTEFEYRNGLNFSRGSSGETIKVVGVSDFQQNSRLESSGNLSEITMEGTVRENDLLKEGDLLFVRSNGNKALIGRCLQIGEIQGRVSFSGFTIRGRKKEGKLTSEFASLLFRSQRFRNYLDVAGGGTNISNLSQRILEDYPLTFPVEDEQRKIAGFLGAVDTKIAQLAEKKRLLEDYKKGCMQQLFFQKIRFKDDTDNDFPDWEEKRLGEIGEVRTSSVDKLSQEGEKSVGLLNYMDVYRRDHIRKSDRFQKVTAPDGQIATTSLREGDVLFTPSSETPTDIGHSAVVMEDLPSVLFSYHLVRFRPNPNLLVPKFSGYAFKSHRFYVELWKRAQGATRYTLSKSALEESSVPLPHPDEQRKIADFLSALDRKIDLVGQELTHSRSFKQGLLQQMFV